jgi:hypothetical protein
VTLPAPSARPPQLNICTVIGGGRRASKSRHPFIKLLTTRVELATSLWTPLVIRSNFWPADPSHSFTATGMRFSRKLPAVGSINRHCPSEVLRDAEVTARVAVLSRCCDFATAVGLRNPPAPETAIFAVGLATTVVSATSVRRGMIAEATFEVGATDSTSSSSSPFAAAEADDEGAEASRVTVRKVVVAQADRALVAAALSAPVEVSENALDC